MTTRAHLATSNDVRIDFRPVINLASGAVVGYEAVAAVPEITPETVGQDLVDTEEILPHTDRT